MNRLYFESAGPIKREEKSESKNWLQFRERIKVPKKDRSLGVSPRHGGGREGGCAKEEREPKREGRRCGILEEEP